MSDFDPDEIIQEVLAGNKDRFRLLVREYGLLVRGYLSARVYHLEDAEDLAQESFLTAYAKLSTYEIGTNFRAWLLTIAKFQLSNHWRKSSRRANAMDKFRHQIAETIQPEMNKASDDLNNLKLQKLLHCITLIARPHQTSDPGRPRWSPHGNTRRRNEFKTQRYLSTSSSGTLALRKCMEKKTTQPAS